MQRLLSKLLSRSSEELTTSSIPDFLWCFLYSIHTRRVRAPSRSGKEDVASLLLMIHLWQSPHCIDRYSLDPWHIVKIIGRSSWRREKFLKKRKKSSYVWLLFSLPFFLPVGSRRGANWKFNQRQALLFLLLLQLLLLLYRIYYSDFAPLDDQSYLISHF